jgi:prevent-host-death family protein
MRGETIPQRELRNNVAEVLRRAEAGTEFTVTVRGRPVARLGPVKRPRERQLEVDSDAFQALLAATPVDEGYVDDLRAARDAEEPVEDPWDRP